MPKGVPTVTPPTIPVGTWKVPPANPVAPAVGPGILVACTCAAAMGLSVTLLMTVPSIAPLLVCSSKHKRAAVGMIIFYLIPAMRDIRAYFQFLPRMAYPLRMGEAKFNPLFPSYQL